MYTIYTLLCIGSIKNSQSPYRAFKFGKTVSYKNKSKWTLPEIIFLDYLFSTCDNIAFMVYPPQQKLLPFTIALFFTIKL